MAPRGHSTKPTTMLTPTPRAMSCSRTSPVRQPSGTLRLNRSTTSTVKHAWPTMKLTVPGVYAERNASGGSAIHNQVVSLPTTAISRLASRKPMMVPSTACRALRCVPSALERSTDSVPSTTQKPCSTSVALASAIAAPRPTAARTALRNATERRCSCARSSRSVRSALAARPGSRVSACAPGVVSTGAGSPRCGRRIGGQGQGHEREAAQREAAVDHGDRAGGVTGGCRGPGPDFERLEVGAAGVVQRVECERAAGGVALVGSERHQAIGDRVEGGDAGGDERAFVGVGVGESLVGRVHEPGQPLGFDHRELQRPVGGRGAERAVADAGERAQRGRPRRRARRVRGCDPRPRR